MKNKFNKFKNCNNKSILWIQILARYQLNCKKKKNK